MTGETAKLPRILLLQARDPGDPILTHELDCFIRRTGLPEEVFRSVNMPEAELGEHLLEGVDLVTVGGAGDYSVVAGGFDWHDPMLELLGRVVDREVPMFASCFGFQALVQHFGGRLETDPERAEIGTHTVELTEEGRRDDFFGALPGRFDAQFGHKDSVVELPDGMDRLAGSQRCDIQAVRLVGKPVVATQFHPELSAEDNMERYVRYIENYAGTDETHEEAVARAESLHRESPEANELLARYLERLFPEFA